MVKYGLYCLYIVLFLQLKRKFVKSVITQHFSFWRMFKKAGIFFLKTIQIQTLEPFTN